VPPGLERLVEAASRKSVSSRVPLGGGGVPELSRLVEAISRNAVSSKGGLEAGGCGGAFEGLVALASRNAVSSLGRFFALPGEAEGGAGCDGEVPCAVASESKSEETSAGSGCFAESLGRLCGSSVISPIRLPAAKNVPRPVQR